MKEEIENKMGFDWRVGLGVDHHLLREIVIGKNETGQSQSLPSRKEEKIDENSQTLLRRKEEKIGENSQKTQKLALGGIEIDCGLFFVADSDGDVVIHALCNAISSAIGGGSLSTVTDEMCRKGITDSKEYLWYFVGLAAKKDWAINNISLSVEAGRPHLEEKAEAMKKSLAEICAIDIEKVGISFTSGEGLTACSRGEGIYAQALVSLIKKD